MDGQRAHGTVCHEHNDGGGRFSPNAYCTLGMQDGHGRARKNASVEKDIGPPAGSFAKLVQDRLTASAVACDARVSASELGQFCVHSLYKRPEIPAKKAIPAFAVSLTYRKHEKAANPGSIHVSATNSSTTYGQCAATHSHHQRSGKAHCTPPGKPSALPDAFRFWYSSHFGLLPRLVR